MPGWRGVAAVLGFVVAVASCRQLVGVVEREEERASTGGQAEAGCAPELPTGVARACQDCLAGNCCAEVSACEKDGTCKSSFDCILGCAPGDDACVSACSNGFGPLLASALACRAKSCSTSCDVECGDILGVAYPNLVASAAGCASCATAKVCGELAKCAQDAACLRHASCFSRSCPLWDRSCLSKCAFDSGASPDADTLWTQLQSQCGAECRIGTNWDCVGQYAWSVGTTGKSTVSLRLVRQLTGDPLVGTQIRVCSTTSLLCDGPVSTSTTDATGFVHLESAISLPGPVLNGYLEISGGAAGDGGVPQSTLGFLFPPLAGPLYGDESYTPYENTVVLQSEWDALAAFLPTKPEKTLGHVAALIHDCSGGWASGLLVDATPKGPNTVVYYSKDGVPAPSAVATDRSGGAAVLNLEPGTVNISVRLQATNQVVSQGTVIARAGWLTAALLAPQPKQ